MVVEKKKDPLDALPKGTFDLEVRKNFFFYFYWKISIIFPFFEVMILGVPYISTNIYCISRNFSNTDLHNYSIYLR